MLNLEIKTLTREYDSQIHENPLTIDHISAYAYSSSMKPFTFGQTDVSMEMRQRFKDYIRGISDDLPRVKDKAGRKYRDFVYGRARIDQNSIAVFYDDYVDAVSCESIIYKPEGTHSVWFTLNGHHNIRRLYENTCYFDREFDEIIRINNSNYVIPEVMNSKVVQEHLFEFDYVVNVAQAVYALFFGDKCPKIDTVRMSQIEITRDYTVPFYTAQQCMHFFTQYLMSPEGVRWRERHGFVIMSYFGNSERGDSGIKLSRMHPALVFKVYAKNMVTLRTELRVESPRTLDYFHLSRDLCELRKVYDFLGRMLRSYGFKDILKANFKPPMMRNQVRMDKYFFKLPDLCTSGFCSYFYGRLSAGGIVSASKGRKFMTPELKSYLEPLKHGNKCYYHLPCNKPLRKRCMNCNTYHLIDTLKCSNCGSFHMLPTNTNVGRVGILRSARH